MNFNSDTRKKISRMIIDKADELNKDEENFKFRLNEIATNICDPLGKDAKSRSLLIDYFDSFSNPYEELKWLDDYRFNDGIKKIESIEEKEAREAEEKRKDEEYRREHPYDFFYWYNRDKKRKKEPSYNVNYSVEFFDKENIDATEYIPHWEEYMGKDKKCGENKDIPMTFKDCKKVWEIFYKYYPGMPKETIKKSDMWEKNAESIRTPNAEDGIPRFPSPEMLKNSTSVYKKQGMLVEGKEYITIKTLLESLKIFSNCLFQGEDFKTCNYSELAVSKDTKTFDSPVNYPAIIYRRVQNKYFGEHTGTENPNTNNNDSVSKAREAARKDIENYNTGDSILFKNVNSIAPATLSDVRVDHWTRTEKYGSTINYHHTFRGVVTINLYLIIGGGTLNVFKGNYCYIAKDSINIYIDKIKETLLKAQESYNKSSENIKTVGEDKNYKMFLNYLDECKKELEKIYIEEEPTISEEEKKDPEKYNKYKEKMEIVKGQRKEAYKICKKIINTLLSSFNSWIDNRIKTLNVPKGDKTTAEGIKSILSSRMDKTNGTLFSWYAQDIIPTINEYIKNKQNLKNSLFLFDSKILTQPDAGLNYTQEENGGMELNNPTFIDVPENIYLYYNKVGVYDNFKAGDIVYILDDVNPEIECQVVSTNRWLAVIGSDEDENGDPVKKYGNVFRINLNKSIPNVMKYDSIRIVKKI